MHTRGTSNAMSHHSLISGPKLMPAPLPEGESRSWYAVYTVSNHEKQVEKYFRLQGLESFLPLYHLNRRWKNRTTVALEIPLFASYVFVRIAGNERTRVLELPSVLSLVGNGRNPVPLPDRDIEALRIGLHLRKIEPFPYLKTGRRVRIRSGALAGLEGVVLRKDNHLRVVLSLDLIQRSIAVHVEACELEACA